MKVDNVVLVCNNNNTYSKWWNSVSKVWKVHIGLDPILYFIDDTGKEVDLDETYGKVIRLEHNPNLEMFEETSMYRLWKMYTTNDTILSTDIDIYPLSKKYYNDCLTDIDENLFVWLNSPTYSKVNLRHNFQSNVTKGSTFRELIDSKIPHASTFEQFIKSLADYTRECIKKAGNQEWDYFPSKGKNRNLGLDELCLKYILNGNERVISITPAGINKEYYLEPDWYYEYRYHEIFKCDRYTDVENKIRNGYFTDFLPTKEWDPSQVEKFIKLAFGDS